LLATQKIACGHMDRGHLQQSLLCDRLSQPTAEMAESLLALQGQTDLLQRFAERDPAEPPPTSGTLGSRPVLLLATAYSILFGLRCEVGRTEGAQGVAPALSRSADPVQPADFVAAFNRALRRPDEFLQDLLALRAQVVPREKLFRVLPLVRDDDGLRASAFVGPYRGILCPLTAFVRAAIDCAEIYIEIRDSAAAGRMDMRQVATLLDGEQSDQRRMIDAMGIADFGVSMAQNGHH